MWYTSITTCILDTDRPRELKYVSNYVLYSCNKIYKQGSYLNVQILKRSSEIRKVTDKGRGYTNKITDISETKNSKRVEMCIK